MKMAAVLMIAIMAMAAHATPMQKARDSIPELAGMDDLRAVEYLHNAYYQDIPVRDLASRLGVAMPEPHPGPKKLGPIDAWRYRSCQEDAAKAPTERGVNIGLRLCREKFEQ